MLLIPGTAMDLTILEMPLLPTKCWRRETKLSGWRVAYEQTQAKSHQNIMNQLNVHTVLSIVWLANKRKVCNCISLPLFIFFSVSQIIQKFNLEFKKKRVKCYPVGKKALKCWSILSTELLSSPNYLSEHI